MKAHQKQLDHWTRTSQVPDYQFIHVSAIDVKAATSGHNVLQPENHLVTAQASLCGVTTTSKFNRGVANLPSQLVRGARKSTMVLMHLEDFAHQAVPVRLVAAPTNATVSLRRISKGKVPQRIPARCLWKVFSTLCNLSMQCNCITIMRKRIEFPCLKNFACYHNFQTI